MIKVRDPYDFISMASRSVWGNGLSTVSGKPSTDNSARHVTLP